MSREKEPQKLLDFPCHYQFKAVGCAGAEFKNAVISAIDQHISVKRDAIICRPSGKGNYQSVSVMVTLHNAQQLRSIYAEMKQIDGLKMLL